MNNRENDPAPPPAPNINNLLAVTLNWKTLSYAPYPLSQLDEEERFPGAGRSTDSVF